MTKSERKKEALRMLNEAAKQAEYSMTLLEEGIWKLISKKVETEDLDEEADNFFAQEAEKKKFFFDVLRTREFLEQDLFFFECIHQKDEIIICMWDFDFHSPRT